MSLLENQNAQKGVLNRAFKIYDLTHNGNGPWSMIHDNNNMVFLFILIYLYINQNENQNENL